MRQFIDVVIHFRQSSHVLDENHNDKIQPSNVPISDYRTHYLPNSNFVSSFLVELQAYLTYIPPHRTFLDNQLQICNGYITQCPEIQERLYKG
jgi:hypothetical protein